MDLDKLKLKTASQLSEPEREFVRQNVDKLNDEDKDAYASFLNVEDAPPAGEEDAGAGGEGDDGAGAGTGTEVKDDTTPPDGAGSGTQPPNNPQPYQFKTEDEAKTFVRNTLEENERAKKAAIDAAKTPEEKKYVEDNWKPQTWNQGISTIAKIVKEEIREEDRRTREKANFDEFDRQWKELSAEKKIPSLDTLDGRKIHAQIIGLMTGFGLSTFKEGYAKWEKLTAAEKAATAPPTPPAGGEGEGGKPAIDPSEAGAALAAAKAKKIADQKKAAGKIGAQNAGAGSTKGSASIKPTALDIRTKSVAKLIKEGLAQA